MKTPISVELVRSVNIVLLQEAFKRGQSMEALVILKICTKMCHIRNSWICYKITLKFMGEILYNVAMRFYIFYNFFFFCNIFLIYTINIKHQSSYILFTEALLFFGALYCTAFQMFLHIKLLIFLGGHVFRHLNVHCMQVNGSVLTCTPTGIFTHTHPYIDTATL